MSKKNRPSPASSKRTRRLETVKAHGAVHKAASGATIVGVAGVGTYAISQNVGAAAAASLLAALVATVQVLLSHLRGRGRDDTYRQAITCLNDGKLVTEQTLYAMATYEAIASHQLNSADIASLLSRAIDSHPGNVLPHSRIQRVVILPPADISERPPEDPAQDGS